MTALTACPRCHSRLIPQRGEPECLNCGTIAATSAPLERLHHEPAMPEFEDGCTLHTSCFTCPYEECKLNNKASKGVMPLFVID